MNKISGIYKITNTITNDFYIGSSKDVKRRWKAHKCNSSWNRQPNNPMYKDMKQYDIDKFVFEILAEIEEGKLKEMEQRFIEKLKPTYNSNNAKGLDIERYKEYRKAYYKEYYKAYRDELKKYQNQLCYYNGETLKLYTLVMRFKRQGIEHPTLEAKKYLIETI